MTATLADFETLPPALEASEPPAARDGVRLLVSAPAAVESATPARLQSATPAKPGGPIKIGRPIKIESATPARLEHRRFTDLPELLRPGDLLVVNNSATLPAAVRMDLLAVHFSTETDSGDWIVELRRRTGGTTLPYDGASAGEWLPLPGGATLHLVERRTPRLWRARLDRPVLAYLMEHGVPIRYSYVDKDWPLDAYQTAFAIYPGSAEMPSAGRPFTSDLVTALVARGIAIAPITLHTGVASLEKDEPPYAERFDVSEPTARLVRAVKGAGGRVIAVGTTVVRALETAVGQDGVVRAASGWTSHVVTPGTGVRAVNGLLTGLHEPRSSHLLMLSAIAGEDHLTAAYTTAIDAGYLWHEFGDVHLILPG